MVRFTLTLVYVPGKDQITDALSRATSSDPDVQGLELIEEVETFSDVYLSIFPATPVKLDEIRLAQENDEECAVIYVKEGWPNYMSHQPLLRPYWEVRSHLSISRGLLLYDERLVMPRSMRIEVLNGIHE